MCIMKLYWVALLVFFFHHQKASEFLLDYFEGTPHSTSFYKCFYQTGRDKIGLYLFSYGFGQDQIQPLITSIYNAKNSGISVQVAFLPCNRFGVQREVQSILKFFGSQMITRFWIVPVFSEKEDWPECAIENFSPSEKCAYLEDLVNSFKSNRLNAEIIAQRQEWEYHFAEVKGCPSLGKNLLWWKPEYQELDDSHNFSNYKKFGGWDVPYMKFLNSSKYVCGARFVVSYFNEEGLI